MFYHNAYDGRDIDTTCLEFGHVSKQINVSSKFSYQVLWLQVTNIIVTLEKIPLGALVKSSVRLL